MDGHPEPFPNLIQGGGGGRTTRPLASLLAGVHRCHPSQRGTDVVGDMGKLQQLALAPQPQRSVQAWSLRLRGL